MKLRNKSNFDLHFDIKNLPELELAINVWPNPAMLMQLMYAEIIALNQEISVLEEEANLPKPMIPGE